MFHVSLSSLNAVDAVKGKRKKKNFNGNQNKAEAKISRSDVFTLFPDFVEEREKSK